MPQPDWVYYAAGIGLIVVSVAAWIGSFYRFPGNWVVVVLAAASAYFLPQKNGQLGLTWTTVAVLAGVAVLGEVVEYFAGRSAGHAGGVHRRSLVIAMIGGISGALLGSVLTLPIPIIGPSLSLLVGTLAGVASGFQQMQTQSTAFGVTQIITGTGRNAGLQGTADVLNVYARQIQEAIARDGFFVRVPAGKQFYLYVTQTIDQAEGTRGNRSNEEIWRKGNEN